MKCKSCKYCMQMGRQKAIYKYPDGGRARFFCGHTESPSHSFIAFSTMENLLVPNIKTQKRWCPLKRINRAPEWFKENI